MLLCLFTRLLGYKVTYFFPYKSRFLAIFSILFHYSSDLFPYNCLKNANFART